MSAHARPLHTAAATLMSRRELLAALGAMALAACKVETIINSTDTTGFPRFPGCGLDTDFMVSAAARDAIRPLDDPAWVRAHESVPEYLDAGTRVIGLDVFGLTYAVPHNVLWHHEVLNLDPGGPLGPKLGITHCPLTGSSRVFDRASIGGGRLAVSGILFMNNLMFFDRSPGDESIWPQMLGTAGCGPLEGTRIETYPFVEMSWAEWVALHPTTRVPAQDQGFDPPFDYADIGYPYGPYRTIETFYRPHAMPPADTRRFSKDVVIGVPSKPGAPGIAFPHDAFTELEGSFQTVGFLNEGASAMVLWSDAAQGGAAFWPRTVTQTPVTLRATTSGFEDDETGSTWTVDGVAVSGPLAGERLAAIDEAYTAYWRAWAAFNPDTRIWQSA